MFIAFRGIKSEYLEFCSKEKFVLKFMAFFSVRISEGRFKTRKSSIAEFFNKRL